MAPVDRLKESSTEVVNTLRVGVGDVVGEIKPRLRGWLHLGSVPLAIAAGVVLIVLSPSTTTRTGAAVFMSAAVLLFTVSALYHTRTWSARAHNLLQRFDHASIFVLIAGSYTPFALLLLEPADAWLVLTIVWGGAVLGVAIKVLWAAGPRWLHVLVYVALGWAAVFWFDEFADDGQVAVLVLMIVGGALYSLGGLVYGFRRPDPSPRWFGFHEVFHSLTIMAFAAHYVGVFIATYSLR
ncbi:hemolysin III family protein [soil metagenome]